LPEICGAFYKKYPQVGVTVDVGNTGGLQQLLEKLKKGAALSLIAEKFVAEVLAFCTEEK